MNKISRIITALLIAVMIIGCMPSCSNNNYAMMIGDAKISKEQYKAIAISLKTQFLTENGVDYTVYDGDMLGSIGELEQDAENWSVYWACYYNGEYGIVDMYGINYYSPQETANIIEKLKGISKNPF